MNKVGHAPADSPTRSEGDALGGAGAWDERRDELDQRIHVERLRDVPCEPRHNAAIPVARVVIAGDGDGENVVKGGLAMDEREELAAVHVGHREVQQQHVRLPRPENRQRLLAAPGGPNCRAFMGDEVPEDLEGVHVVVRHEDRDSGERCNHMAV
jgi:hypothetical protein